MTTAQEVYEETVRRLPPSERLRLATLILEELSQTTAHALDSCEPWSHEDERDVARFSLEQAAIQYPEDEDLV